MRVLSPFRCVRLIMTDWTAAHQAPLRGQVGSSPREPPGKPPTPCSGAAGSWRTPARVQAAFTCRVGSTALQTPWAPRYMKHLPSSSPENTSFASASSRHRTSCSQGDPLPAPATQGKFLFNVSLAVPRQITGIHFCPLTVFFLK